MLSTEATLLIILLFEIIFTPEATKEMNYRKEVKIPQNTQNHKHTRNGAI